MKIQGFWDILMCRLNFNTTDPEDGGRRVLLDINNYLSCEILGSHSGNAEDLSLLEYNTAFGE
jgi:hypothetical protein